MKLPWQSSRGSGNVQEPSSTVADSSKLQAAESVHPPPSTSVMQDSVNDKYVLVSFYF